MPKPDYSHLQPNTREFLAKLDAGGAPPINKLTPQQARAVLDEVQAGACAKLPADIEDRTLSVGPQGQVSVRVVRPRSRGEGVLPAVMYFHGGGWIMGNKDTHDRLIREIANGAQAAVVFVNYTPSPEARYPTAIEEAYAATKFVSENGSSLRLDSSRLALAGDSVGGNMVAAVTLLAKERGTPKLAFQLLYYPVTDASFETDSYQQFADGPWLTREAMKWFWDAYAPDHSKRNEPTASPLRASLEQLRGLPPALIITDENDVLRDEGEAYARKLTQAGVSVGGVRYLGTLHDFVMLNPITDDPAPREAIAEGTTALRNAFAKSAGTGATATEARP
ncbi:MAG TPA: alpha/beta hydrolase [Anaeromyxobacteraceae bacterium]|nr:alpha/beta hydrolase [Anaeromyxobacteraceae bacterium]